MAEVFTPPFTYTTSGYTAGSGTLAVSSAAPAAIQSGTFSVRLNNAQQTVLKVTGGASTTTWTVVAEYNDANASASTNVYGCELSPRALAALLQQNACTYGADSGSANTYAVTLAPAPTIVGGSSVLVQIANGNTGASTLAVNGGSANAIKKNGSSSLVTGDLNAGQIYLLTWDATNSWWQIVGGGGGTSGGGSSSNPIATKTSNYTATTSDGTLLADAASGAFTISLPASPTTGQILIIKKIDASSNAVTIAGNGKTIDGNTSVLLSAPYQSYSIQYNGSAWFVI